MAQNYTTNAHWQVRLLTFVGLIAGIL